jgi:A/G-specific adenine glycosylase
VAVDLSRQLLRWYDRGRRALPWRAEPGESADPYRVWLSEVMLQQTTVAAVRPYFEAFTARWPTVQALAAASDAEVMAAWAGLGYYARARNMLACARKVAAEHGGRFPDSEVTLRTLPGIGRYTAAAIAAIAFGRRAVVVDGNVERVASRLFAVETPLPAARPELYELVDRITPDHRAGDFGQAMMDLGATICTPRAPRCLLCPVSRNCAAVATGRPELYPKKAAKRERPRRHGFAYWLEQDGHVLLVRRPGKGLLGGMLGLPTGPWGESAVPAAPAEIGWTPAGLVEHGFTHFSLTLHLLRGRASDRSAEGLWWPVDRIGEAGLPTLFARAAERAMAAGPRTLAA